MAGSEETLNVIALVSGGKDSFFSILHCLANGHRVVALANLYPPPPPTAADLTSAIRVTSQNPQRHHVWHPSSFSSSSFPSASGAKADDNGGTGGGASGIGHPQHEQQQHQHHLQLQDGSERGEGHREGPEDQDEADLNSFMYQTVGHQVIPLYARATGLPLFRHPIVGTAVHHGLSYDHQRQRRHRPNGEDEEQQEAGTKEAEKEGSKEDEKADETESLVPLLRAVLAAHPEANALCTGAILSTYQRTRVESVALRLGLVPLSYLWQFPELPLDRREGASGEHHHQHDNDLAESAAPRSSGKSSGSNDDDNYYINTTSENDRGTGQQQQPQEQSLLEQQGQLQQQHQQRRPPRQRRRRGGGEGAHHGDADNDDGAHQLLRDMAAVGLDARIVKVASAGLDEGFLWENVASEAGLARVRRAMRRFGGMGGDASRGSVLGEGGEFETLVVDGPPSLFRRGRIVVAVADRPDDAKIVREGGGSAWLSIRRATFEPKERSEEIAAAAAAEPAVRVPGLLDLMFRDVLEELSDVEGGGKEPSSHDDVVHDVSQAGEQSPSFLSMLQEGRLIPAPGTAYEQWCFIGSSVPHNGANNGTPEETEAGVGLGTDVAAQTARVVRDIRERLRELGRPASAIANAVVVLRRMADFPAFNAVYGGLFAEPNPSARVTVSCGDALLPGDSHVAIYLAVQATGAFENSGAVRRGLHVQSRSYWAPANIGPYSQSISVPLLSPSSSLDASGGDDRVRAVSIAGQIPLIPASMTLPTTSDSDGDGDGLALQVTLALQHLWRVGAATDVRWWAGAAAYFPRNAAAGGGDPQQIREAALLAAAAWRAAHLWALAPGEKDDDDEDEDDDQGPDLWDRRFNSAFRTFGGGDGGDGEAATRTIPDWRVVRGFDDDESRADRSAEKRSALPYVFAAEVEELPRGAAVEWHAHLGLAGVGLGSVHPWSSGTGSSSGIELHHVLVRAAAGIFVHTTAAVQRGSDADLGAAVADVRRRVASDLGVDADASVALQLVYADREAFPVLAIKDEAEDGRREESAGRARTPPLLPVLPCHSLWGPEGRRLALVAVFQTRFYTPGSGR